MVDEEVVSAGDQPDDDNSKLDVKERLAGDAGWDGGDAERTVLPAGTLSGAEKENLMERDGGEAELSVPPAGSLSGAEKGSETGSGRTWQWSVVFLCFYGFMVQLKPGEPFITPFLLSSEKNFTREQVTNEITPILSYSYMVVLVPVFLLTDYLRYKPVLIIQSMSHVSIWLLLLLGSSLVEMQLMEFFYGITMAARVAYSSYIFSLVPPEEYQRVAGCSRSAVLLGLFCSSVLGQLCVSLGGLSYGALSAVSLGLVSVGLLLALCLPRPQRSLFFNRAHRRRQRERAEAEQRGGREEPEEAPGVSCWRDCVLLPMLREVRQALRRPSLRLWSLWWVFNSTGYYLVVFYVHILWNKVGADNAQVYNGGVEAASTLLGAAASFAAGFVRLRWAVWSELLIGVITALQGGLLLLMYLTDNIWVCYTAYTLFRGFYQFLVPIAIFQIASSLTKELCALVFGINTFLSTILKTIIILIVADKRGLALPVHSQFLIYFFYFGLLTLTYLSCAAWVIIGHCRSQSSTRGRGEADQATPTELCAMATDPEPEPLSNGKSPKA